MNTLLPRPRPRRSVLVFLCVAAVTLAWLPQPASAQGVYHFSNMCGNNLWTSCCGNGLDCPDGLYANNWNTFTWCVCPPMPGPGDTAHINTAPATCNGGEIATLFVTTPFTVTAPLYVYQHATFDAPVEIRSYLLGGGTFVYNQPVTTAYQPGHSFSFGSGIHEAHAAVTVPPTAPLEITGDLRIHSALTWEGDTTLTIDGAYSQNPPGGILRNLAGATILATGDGSMAGIIGLGYLFNDGTFRKQGGSGTTTIASQFQSTGLVDVQTGALRLTGPDTLLAGTVAISAAGSLSIAGTFATLGNVVVSGPGLLGAEGYGLDVAPGATALVNHLLLRTGRAGTGTLTVTGSLTSEGASFNSGTTNLAASAIGLFQGAAYTSLSANAIFNNYGSITWTGNHLVLTETSVFINQAGALLDCQTDSDLSGIFTSGQFINHGTLRKSAGAPENPTIISVPFLNTGTVEVDAGRLGFSSLTQAESGSIVLSGTVIDQYGAGGFPLPLAAGRLTGTGEVTIGLSNTGGRVEPGAPLGTLATPFYTQGPSAALHVDLAGTVPGSGHDQLVVTSAAVLDGALTVTLLGGFAPAPGAVFTILTCGSCSGQFSSVALPPGFELEYLADGVRVVAGSACPADFNDSGTVTTSDISAFLSAWFADISGGTTTADFNNSGSTTTADISAFLSAWFAAISGGGCP
ncbi:MAG TPA: hypothetical protein VD963_00955 [Phycisphaerales bacterium]|nr:hypothetical protein [Phycisphaerales bacterium]